MALPESAGSMTNNSTPLNDRPYGNLPTLDELRASECYQLLATGHRLTSTGYPDGSWWLTLDGETFDEGTAPDGYYDLERTGLIVEQEIGKHVDVPLVLAYTRYLPANADNEPTRIAIEMLIYERYESHMRFAETMTQATQAVDEYFKAQLELLVGKVDTL